MDYIIGHCGLIQSLASLFLKVRDSLKAQPYNHTIGSTGDQLSLSAFQSYLINISETTLLLLSFRKFQDFRTLCQKSKQTPNKTTIAQILSNFSTVWLVWHPQNSQMSIWNKCHGIRYTFITLNLDSIPNKSLATCEVPKERNKQLKWGYTKFNWQLL